jgi:hypothetical protein
MALALGSISATRVASWFIINTSFDSWVSEHQRTSEFQEEGVNGDEDHAHYTLKNHIIDRVMRSSFNA